MAGFYRVARADRVHLFSLNGIAFRETAREAGIIPTQQEATMKKPKPDKMRHMSLLLPPHEHEAFRFLCCGFDMKPSEALRAMVRIALGGGYQQHDLKKRGVR